MLRRVLVLTPDYPTARINLGNVLLQLGKAAEAETFFRSLVNVDARISKEYPDRKSTRLNSSHLVISYAVFCLKKKSTVSYRYARLHVLVMGQDNGLTPTTHGAHDNKHPLAGDPCISASRAVQHELSDY